MKIKANNTKMIDINIFFISYSRGESNNINKNNTGIIYATHVNRD